MPSTRSKQFRKRGSRRSTSIPLETLPNYRIRIVFSILCIAILSLIGRMAWLQIIQAPALEAEARARQTFKTQPLGTRRNIVDREGRLVALDEERYRLWAHPRYFQFPGDDPNTIRKPVDVAKKLSKYKGEIDTKFLKKMKESQ